MQTQTQVNGSVAAILKPEWKAAETKEQVLQKWLDANKALTDAKAVEATLRQKVVEMYPFEADEGTERVPLANGYELKVVKKLNYTLNNKDDATDKALTKLEEMGERGKLIAERLVSWKPTLSISEYRELTAGERGIIDEVLTIKPGLPSLELVEPKDKK